MGQELQREWCAANAPTLPKGPLSARGAALYTQLDAGDELVLLVTAQWASVEQHHECIRSEINKRALTLVNPYIKAESVRIFHVEGIELFSDGEMVKVNGKPTLTAEWVTVVKYMVNVSQKAAFERGFGKARAVLDAYTMPYVHGVGWKAEKEEGQETEEYVLVGGWDSEEKMQKFVKGSWEDTEKYLHPLMEFLIETEVKAHNRAV
ncbi:hypothetical protein F5Y15DRAFT_404012 [Xylariaceae sp. FL0016]|nr:hypothetical protein F5Y15DRAFT_404012 [Xylariaceae sp. FL0016]